MGGNVNISKSVSLLLHIQQFGHTSTNLSKRPPQHPQTFRIRTRKKNRKGSAIRQTRRPSRRIGSREAREEGRKEPMDAFTVEDKIDLPATISQ